SLTEGQAIPPEKIHMGYWYAETGKLEIFDYDSTQFNYAETILRRMIADIQSRTTFELTDNTRHCGFCTYRSLCGRGKAAKGLDEMDVVLDIDETFDLDWEAL
nr:PD-(D/E)XK nuclease family protein [Anaerolineae bacterium]